jgi:excisionase family DNA binding protein
MRRLGRGKKSGTLENSQLSLNLDDKLIFENKLVWQYGDTAKFLKCGIRHVKTLVSQDRIPHTRLGRLVRFSPVLVSEWFLNGGTR